MGLDQYAYTVDTNGKKEEIAYWRKHPNLQGFMENLWESKGRPGDRNENSELGDFNCIPIELDYDDLAELESAVSNSELPSTGGFFFGDNSDNEYKQQDMEFVHAARTALDNGCKVMYDSWW